MLTIKYGLIRRKSDKDCMTQIILNSQKNIYLYMRDLLARFLYYSDDHIFNAGISY